MARVLAAVNSNTEYGNRTCSRGWNYGHFLPPWRRLGMRSGEKYHGVPDCGWIIYFVQSENDLQHALWPACHIVLCTGHIDKCPSFAQ